MTSPLDASRLRAPCDPAGLPFRSTAELPPLDGMIGQERAARATRFGIGMRHEGYNLFVLGPAASGKTRTMRRLLGEAARDAATASDWCYVHNFADPYRPAAVELPAGRGRDLRAAMQRLVEECRSRVPRAFESEEFAHQKARILEQLATRHKDEMDALEREVTAQGFVNGSGELVGIVTLDDIVALLAEEFSTVGALLERESPHHHAA